MTQEQVAEVIGVDETTVWNWESNRCEPTIARMPELTKFLGYVLTQSGTTNRGERLKIFRVLSGMSQKAIARHLGIDPSTLSKLESGNCKSSRKILARVEELLKDGLQIK